MRYHRSAFRSPRGRSWRYGLASSTIVLAMSVIGLPGVAQADSGNQLQITAMTYNLFQGTELTEASSATTPAQFLAAVAADYGEVQTTDFPQRAQAIAAEAQSAAPDLIGLQEAALWQTGAPSATYPPPPPTTVSYDFVKILVAALNARGLHYAPVAVTTDFTLQGPGLFRNGLMSVQLTDRVAILARSDVPLTISNVQTGTYTHNTVVSSLQGPITLTEGWASVDATLGHHTVRFVTTHLADNSDAIGSAQAAELVQGPLNTDLPLIMTCDCNADPTTATYAVLTAAGLKDSWAQAEPGQPGYTCCQDTTLGNALLNPESTLNSRIDYIFTRGGGLKAAADQIIGANPASRSVPGGFWPSDHAGLIAELAQGGWN
jgi:endonuclease/exonuclease/phosphatase family metal-dependent hydrolase